jgi:hypothetical protein
MDGSATVGASTERGEDEEDYGRGQESPFSGVVIAHPSKKQLSNDSTSKCNGVDILLGRRCSVLFLVENLQYSVDLTNDTSLWYVRGRPSAWE